MQLTRGIPGIKFNKSLFFGVDPEGRGSNDTNTVKCPVESAPRGLKFMRTFESLTEQEVLALAIVLEEEDERVYSDFAENFRKDFPATASMFEGMRDEESTHRRRLIDLYRTKFGEHIPLIRRGDVKGPVTRHAIWLTQPFRPDWRAGRPRRWRWRHGFFTRRPHRARRMRASASS